MKKLRGICILVAVLAWFSVTAVYAHQPRLIEDHGPVEIKNPEISQAFYATLDGRPDHYRIEAGEGFKLYVGLLVPDLPDISKEINAKVFRVDPGGSEDLVFMLTGEPGSWDKFYEPFAGDRYYKGPEREKKVPAGIYGIEVTGKDNKGKYVLAVGREERFTFSETLSMIAALPALKRDFFEKSPLTAYFNLVGLFMLMAVLTLLAAGFGLHRLIKYIQNR